jgi:hypothetical protein
MTWKPPATLPDLYNADLIAIDLETDDERLRADKGSGWPTNEGYICGLALAWRAGADIQTRYFSLKHPESVNFDPANVWRWLRDHIAAGERFVTQNGSYDYGTR